MPSKPRCGAAPACLGTLEMQVVRLFRLPHFALGRTLQKRKEISERASIPRSIVVSKPQSFWAWIFLHKAEAVPRWSLSASPQDLYI